MEHRKHSYNYNQTFCYDVNLGFIKTNTKQHVTNKRVY